MDAKNMYRFWDKEKKVMIYPNTSESGVVINVSYTLPDSSAPVDINYLLSRPKRYIPMQCVGRADSTGKLIYESDVLNAHRTRLLGKNTLEQAIVKWKDARFIAEYKDGKTLGVNLWDETNILTNIYEAVEFAKTR